MTDKVDVTIATKNNEDTIGRCIECIKRSIPYNEIIVVDGYSSDNTVQITKKLGAKVFFESGLLGKVRYIQASLCTTEWIAVIDSDVFIYENWWKGVSKYMSAQKVGAITCWLEGSIKEVMPAYEYFTKFQSNVEEPKSFAFSNILIRRKFILDSKNILQKIHVGEDAAVAKNVIKQGYKIVKIPIIRSLHYHKDPIGHAKMEYNRIGQSFVISKITLRESINILAMPVITARDLIKYLISSRKLDLKLYLFYFWLHIELLRGIIGEIKNPSNEVSL